MTSEPQTREFQAEARQLLRLVVHSIYSNKDIFLRELISNASDALDKARLASMLDKDLAVDLADPHITIEVDRDARTLTVRDNGIGMSRDEVVNLIGTIAKSGTAEFLRRLAETTEAAASRELIGAFGIGFYSAFMVADEVTLVTRRAGTDEGVRWHSTGEGTYTIEPAADLPQGTAVTLHLKPADEEDHLFDYTSPWKIRELVKRYSDFIPWPIRMAVPDPDGGADATRVETLNSMKAIWARPRDEVTQAEYHEFYKHISHDWNDPLEVIHVRAEGSFEYQALLFLPSYAAPDLFTAGARHGVHLYVKRVFIMADCAELMPAYLRFVRGVVDAADLSLNVSREILQRDRHIALMRRRLVRRVLSTIKDMMTAHPDRYATVWSQFGAVLKEGLLADDDNRATILDISSFASSHDPERPTTLRGYVERMKPGQEHIYYLTGDSRATIEGSPHLEALTARGFEVLYLTDPVDEVWVEAVPDFDGHPLRSVAKGEVDLDTTEEEKKAAEAEREQRREQFAPLLAWLGGKLSDQVKQVRLSTRLTTSPACVVSDEHDLTPTLERMYRAMGQQVPPVRRILELNPTHPLVAGLRRAYDGRGDDADLAGTAEILYGMALLAEGGEVTDPARLVNLLADRLARTL